MDENNLNSLIKLDLHIHSKLSGTMKSGDQKITLKSDKENIDTLFSKLNEHGINLISITDHNSFDVELFLKLKERIDNEKNETSVKGIIPGVEFDVSFSSEEEFKGQINAYFNYKNENDLKAIANVLLKYKIKENGSYSKDNFESILKEIGLDVILISEQRGSIKQGKKKNDPSFSSHCYDPISYINFQYLEAMQFSKPRIESIIKNDLFTENVQNKIKLIGFSDCHEWTAYPHHDNSQINSNNKFFTIMKILPTFKGLLLGLTSNNRINRQDSKLKYYLQKIRINDKEVFFDKSINVIFGDNSSGKSFLLDVISTIGKKHVEIKKKLEKYKNFYKNNSNIHSILNDDNCKIYEWFKENMFFIEQNSLAKIKIYEEFANDKIDFDISRNFITEINNFKESLIYFCENSIKLRSISNFLSENLSYKFISFHGNYFISIISDENLINKNTTIYDDFVNNLKITIDSIKKLIDEKYSTILIGEDKKDLENQLLFFENLLKKYTILDKTNEFIYSMKNQIRYVINSVNNENQNTMSTIEKSEKDIIQDNKYIISNIIDTYKIRINFLISKHKLNNPFLQYKYDSYKDNQLSENFLIEYIPEYSDFNKTDLLNKIISIIFMAKIKNINDIKTKLLTREEWSKNLKNYDYNKNFQSDFDYKILLSVLNENFKKAMSSFKNYMIYIHNNDERDKNFSDHSPGSQSLIYYKYLFSKNERSNIKFILIDQPEDDISNKNIVDKLIPIIEKERDKKQIFIVTHNPHIAIDLDPDNLIYVENIKEKINFEYGCLEFENEKINILKKVLDTIEGGKDSLERRLKYFNYESRNKA